MKGNDRSEEGEKLNLDALRLYAFGIARAHTAMQNDSETRKIQLESALEAFSGSYRLRQNEDAAHNYEVIKRLLDEERKKDEEKRSEEEAKKEETPPEQEELKKEEPKKNQPPEEGLKEGGSEQEGASEKDPPLPASPVPNQGNWTNGGDPQTLRSDPGGNKGANVTVPLSPAERQELENALKGLVELQENRGKYVRPDGTQNSDGNVPNALRELFFGDSFFEGFFQDSENVRGKKSW